MQMNVFNFTGNLGNDCEQKYTPKGDAVCNFSVAVKSGYGDKESTTWVRCGLWGKRAEALSPYLKKGQLVGVSGELTNRPYDDKGTQKYSLEVHVNDVTLLGKSDPSVRNDTTQTSARQNGQEGSSGFDDPDDDINF
jgi:single-strand DNA-binding protein